MTMATRAGSMRGDPSERMFSMAKELLWRQRQIHPFPCDQKKVLGSILPEKINRWVSRPHARIAGCRWLNLSQCVKTGRIVILELNGITGKAFWMRFEEPVPCPDNSIALNIPTGSKYYDRVYDWWVKANVIHEELKAYQSDLWDFLQRANHPLLVKKHWEELHPFVEYAMQANFVREPDLTKRRVVPQFNQAQCDSIIECLAASTLLSVVPCTAWVDYEAEEF